MESGVGKAEGPAAADRNEVLYRSSGRRGLGMEAAVGRSGRLGAAASAVWGAAAMLDLPLGPW